MTAKALKPEQNSGQISPVAVAVNAVIQSEQDFHKQLNESNKTIAAMTERIKKLESLLERAVLEHQREKDLIDYLKQRIYGRSSESRIVKKLDDPQTDNQMHQASLFPLDDNVFNEIEATVHELGKDGITSEFDLPESDNRDDKDNNTDEQHGKTKTAGQKKGKGKKRPGIITMNSADLEKLGLKVVDEVINDGAEFSVCPECGTQMKQIGREVVSTTLEYAPAHYFLKKVWKNTYKCENCSEPDKSFIVRTPSPEPLLAHSVASASIVSHSIDMKFNFGMPLYRQELMMIDAGIPLTRKVLSDWSSKIYINQLAPFVELLRQELIVNHHIHVDESPNEVIKVKGSPGPKQCYMWVYTTTKWNPHRIVIFDFKPGRSAEYPKEFLKGFTGKMHVDGYSGYKSVVEDEPGRDMCACLTHIRRQFVVALRVNTNNSETKILKRLIGLLDDAFKFEREFEERTVGERDPEKAKEMRQKETKPVMDSFFSICKKVKDANVTPPQGAVAKAIDYALAREIEAKTFLDDGNCDIDNNTAENCIRPFVICRKNSLFNFTEVGAEVSAGWLTIVQTAKFNGLNPGRYLNWLLSVIPSIRPKSVLDNLRKLLPWSPDVPVECFAKDIEDIRTQNLNK